MSKPPLSAAAVAMLRKPNPAVITTLRRDGQPVAVATWYLWDDGRLLVSMEPGRKRLEYMRDDPRVALDVLDEADWLTHVSLTGHIDEIREDPDLADIDRLSKHYTGQSYADRVHAGRSYSDRVHERVSAWITVDSWHGWRLQNSSQAG
jgi:PPOX class probable F420-dependent enzyme